MKNCISVVLIAILFCSLFFSLGVRSMSVSAQGSQIYFGAYVGPSHIGDLSRLAAFESDVDKGVSIWNWFQLWNRADDSENVAEFDVSLMDQARAHGAIPMVSWAPERGNANFPYDNLTSILDGSQDAYLISWGQAAAAWGHPFFVRLMWEFTGSWTYGIYPFGDGNSGAAEFVAAWQYVVDKVRAAGATNISWVWCPAITGDSEGVLRSLYPGDSYVDWISTDVYLNSHQGFDQTVNPIIGYMHDIAPTKPLMLAEVGYSGADSAVWWSNFLTNVLPNDAPYVSAVIVWQDPLDGPYTVTDSTTLSAFQRGISSSYYSSNVYGSLGSSPISALGGSLSSVVWPTVLPGSGISAIPIAAVLVVGVSVIVVVGLLVAFMLRKRSKPRVS